MARRRENRRGAYFRTRAPEAERQRRQRGPQPLRASYLTSTSAPASLSFFSISVASVLLMPTLTSLGAPSTRSFASLRPRPVTSRTTLITPILFAPPPLRTTVNSVFSSAAAAGAALGAAAAATATGAALTPHLSSRALVRPTSSTTVRPES